MTDDWGAWAVESWDTLQQLTRRPVPFRGARIHEPDRLRVVAAWPLSQVLHAAVLVDAAGLTARHYAPDLVWASLRRYRKGDGFTDFPLIGSRYYDDNAWIGLACAQRALFAEPAARRPWLHRAEASLRFVSQGVRRGGVLWVEGGRNLHACSTGSAGVLAAAVGRAESGEPRALARQAGEFLDAWLMNPDGLVADSITPEGLVDPAEFTYNQGLGIQLRIERGLLDEAAALAEATAGQFPTERFWQHPPAFNAIHCRALLRLDAVTGTERWGEFVADYARRLWDFARDHRGLVSGAGRYDKGFVLDHAAATGLLAALALPQDRRTLLV